PTLFRSRVLGVDERGDAAAALGVRDRVERQRRLTRGLRAVDLDNASAGQTPDAEGDVECDGTGGDDGDGRALVAAEPHDGSLTELAVDLSEGGLEGLLAVCGCRHVPGLLQCRVPCAHRLSALRRPVKQGPRSRDRAGVSIGETRPTLRPPSDIRMERRAEPSTTALRWILWRTLPIIEPRFDTSSGVSSGIRSNAAAFDDEPQQ